MSTPAREDDRRARLRVVSVIQSFRPYVGGAQIQLERLLPHLAARGVDMTVLTKRYAGEPRAEPLPSGTLRRIALRGASSLSSLLFVLACLAYVLRNRRRIDVVHAHGALSEGLVALGAARVGLPVLVRILRAGHHGDIDRLLTKPAGRRRWKALARRAWFVALSDEARAELVREGAAPERIFAIPNGVDANVFKLARPDDRRALRAGLGLGEELVAVFAGRLFPEKRVEVAVAAVAATPGVKLVVVGDGPERAALERRAAEEGVVDDVWFVGQSDRVPDFLRAADVFVLPSRSEGMSNSLLEAMACGLACLAGPVSGVPELLKDGRGVIVAGEDAASWAEQIQRLVAEPDARAELGRRASLYVQEHHTLDIVADRTAAAYETIQAARGDARR